MKRTSLFDAALLFSSVFLISLSQPSFFFEKGLSFFAWIAYVPFFLLLERLSLKKSVLFGAMYGSLAYLCMCWWISAFGALAISFVCALFAAYNALLFFLISFTKSAFPKNYAHFFWIFRAVLVLSLEFVRTHGIFAFSYGIIGYSQWKNPVLLRFSSLFGVMGGTLLILLVNSLLSKIISEKNLRGNLRKIAFFGAVFLSLTLFWGISSLLPPNHADSVSVALVQNASSAPSRSLSDYERDALLLRKLTDDALRLHPETELVVWAETAIVPDILQNFSNPSDKRRHLLAENLMEYFRGKNTSFLIGNNHRDETGDHNSALYFSPVSKTVGVYNKNHLVPFTEFWPAFLDFPVFDPIKESLDCEFFAHGSGGETFSIKNRDGVSLSFAVPICFEDSFAPLVSEMKRNGADFFVNISDDAWSKSDAARNMHLSMSVFRCAEFASPMIRSTIDGKTCIVGSTGAVLSEISSEQDSVLCGTLRVGKNSRTLYALIGDIPTVILCVFMLLSVLILSVRFAKVNVYGRR